MALPRNWAQEVLRGIRAPVTQQNLRFLAAWQRAEGGGSANNANFNPLNTTQGAPGAGSINSVGVKSYRNPEQGLRATIHTLLNGHYGDIVGGLRSGRASAEQLAHSRGLSTWGTGSGVLRVLGAGGSLTPTGDSPAVDLARKVAGPQQANGGDPALFRQAVASYLIDSSQQLTHGGKVDPNGILQLALARQQLQQPSAPAQQLAAQVNNRAGAAPVYKGGGVQFIGKPLTGLKPDFVNKVSAAVRAIGGTQVNVVSGYRSPAHNAAVGGAKDSNHTYGRAMDAKVYIPGHGWQDLGTALMHVAPKFGLRSGATFSWGGHPDTPHVDDGFNQHH